MRTTVLSLLFPFIQEFPGSQTTDGMLVAFMNPVDGLSVPHFPICTVGEWPAHSMRNTQCPFPLPEEDDTELIWLGCLGLCLPQQKS